MKSNVAILTCAYWFCLATASAQTSQFIITSPAGGTTLSGSTALSVAGVETYTNVGSVQYFIDGIPVSASLAAQPYSFRLNSSMFWDGPSTIHAELRDTRGNMIAKTPFVPVRIANGQAKVEVLSPRPNAIVSGLTNWTVQASHPSGIEAWYFFVDGEPVSLQWGNSASKTFTIDTTRLLNGAHDLFVGLYSAAPGLPPVGQWRGTIQVSNLTSTAGLLANYSEIYLQPGGTVSLTGWRLLPSAGRLPAIGVAFSSDTPSVATVSAAGIVTGISPGVASVTLTQGALTRTVRVRVRAAEQLQHFGKNGKILTSYDPQNSLFVRTLFFANTEEIHKSSVLADRIRTSGVNTLTTGFYFNPADQQAVSLTSWRAGWENWWNNLVETAGRDNMYLLLTGDDIARTNQELSNSISATWSADALQLAFTRARDSQRVVAVEMVDEASFIWGDTPKPQDGRWMQRTPAIPDNAFVTLMNRINQVPGRSPVSWPAGGLSNTQVVANWLGDPTMSDYTSQYWTYMDWRRAFSYSASLPQVRNAMDRVVLGREPVLQQGKPQLLLTSATGPFYTKRVDGAEYQPGKDLLQQPGEAPALVSAEVMYAAARGLAGVRTYGLDWSQWKYERATAPVGRGDLQTGSDPLLVGTDRWQALAGAYNLIRQLEPHLLQPQMNAVDLGPGFVTGARKGPKSRLLMSINFSESNNTTQADLTPYLYPGVGSLLRVRLTASSLTTEVLSARSTDRVTFRPGETVVWLFLPSTITDGIPCGVQITSPQTMGGSAVVLASGVTSVQTTTTPFRNSLVKAELLVDGVIQQTSTVVPYSFRWDNTGITKGAWHTLTVRVTDATGYATDSSIVFQVE